MMSKNTKRWLIAASSLVVIGLIIFSAVMTVNHWNFSVLSTDNFETNTYEIREEFSNIKFNTETCDILFEVSDDNMCRVVCYERENMKHSVTVQNSTLNINAEDNIKWYENISINFHSPKITLYLPKSEYNSIEIKASTGDIDILNEIKVDNTDIALTTGDIKINNMSVGTLDLLTSTGKIIVSDVICTGEIKSNTTTGDVSMINVTCRNLISNGSTSNISLKNVIAEEKFTIERSTGHILFDNSDSGEIFVKTSTGNVTGSLLTEKVFVTKTSTGNIYVPKSASGGKCEIITSTGKIIIEISDGAIVQNTK